MTWHGPNNWVTPRRFAAAARTGPLSLSPAVRAWASGPGLVSRAGRGPNCWSSRPVFLVCLSLSNRCFVASWIRIDCRWWFVRVKVFGECLCLEMSMFGISEIDHFFTSFLCFYFFVVVAYISNWRIENSSIWIFMLNYLKFQLQPRVFQGTRSQVVFSVSGHCEDS